MFRLLVVEDDRELNKTVCAYLSQNGYQTTGCLRVAEAYDAMYGGKVQGLFGWNGRLYGQAGRSG